MRPPGQAEVDAAKADGRWARALAAGSTVRGRTIRPRDRRAGRDNGGFVPYAPADEASRERRRLRPLQRRPDAVGPVRRRRRRLRHGARRGAAARDAAAALGVVARGRHVVVSRRRAGVRRGGARGRPARGVGGGRRARPRPPGCSASTSSTRRRSGATRRSSSRSTSPFGLSMNFESDAVEWVPTDRRRAARPARRLRRAPGRTCARSPSWREPIRREPGGPARRGRGADDRRAQRAHRCRALGAAVLRGRGADPRRPHGRRPAPLPPRHAAAGVVHAHRPAGRAQPRRDPPALASLPEHRTPTRQDWERLSSSWRPQLDARIAPARAAARRPRRVHRLRLPVAATLPALQPRRRARRRRARAPASSSTTPDRDRPRRGGRMVATTPITDEELAHVDGSGHRGRQRARCAGRGRQGDQRCRRQHRRRHVPRQRRIGRAAHPRPARRRRPSTCWRSRSSP